MSAMVKHHQWSKRLYSMGLGLGIIFLHLCSWPVIDRFKWYSKVRSAEMQSNEEERKYWDGGDDFFYRSWWMVHLLKWTHSRIKSKQTQNHDEEEFWTHSRARSHIDYLPFGGLNKCFWFFRLFFRLVHFN